MLFVLPTGQLASAMRAKHPYIDIDTFHGGLLFHRDLSEALGILTQYDLVVLDEVSMLTAAQFDRVLAMWRAAEGLPCMVLLGDFWQLPVVDKDEGRCDESTLWRSSVTVVLFYEQIRCKDPRLQHKLDYLRTAVPSVQQLKDILRGRRAWKTAEPTAWDLLELLRQHPHTTIVTFVNGMSAVIENFDPGSMCLHATTSTGRPLAVHLCTEELDQLLSRRSCRFVASCTFTAPG